MDHDNVFEYQLNSLQNYNEIVEAIFDMIGDGISKDVIYSIVESCEGDLNQAANVVMNIISDGSSVQSNNNEGRGENTEGNNLTEHTDGTLNPAPTMSYAGASRKSNVSKKQTTSTTTAQQRSIHTQPGQGIWTDQVRDIVAHHNQGHKLLIIIRGVPGSGKTYLAKKLIEIMVGSKYSDYQNHILSTDDFFVVRGIYQYNKFRLGDAHDWNKRRALLALQSGVSPIVIDNTNIELWEMEPYLRAGITNGYIVELLEPNTPWAKKAHILCKKNSHNVTYPKIKKMLENFQPATLPYLLQFFRIQYPDSVPPALKPEAIENATVCTKILFDTPAQDINSIESIETISADEQNQQFSDNNALHNTDEIENDVETSQEQEFIEQQLRYMKIQKQLEEMEKIEQEWENGENWDEESNINSENSARALDTPRPKRNDFFNSDKSNADLCIPETFQEQEDWSKISMFMNPWIESNQLSTSLIPPEKNEKKDSETCIEFSDFDATNNCSFKVLAAYPKDINLNHIPNKKEKIPEKRMLDKSTTTNNQTVIETHRCKNEEKHFSAFRKLFKNIPKAILRDVFDKCCGDVNWAVDIVLDGMENNQLKIVNDNEELSDTEDYSQQDCDCIAAYDIIPDKSCEDKAVAEINDEQNELINKGTPQSQKKVKKELNVSDTSFLLKHMIEKNVIISDNHYSDRCLKLRNMRYGIVDEKARGDLSEPIVKHSELPDDESDFVYVPVPSTSKQDQVAASTVTEATIEPIEASDDEDSFIEEPEITVSLDLSSSLLTQLDELFGRKDIAYPNNVVPKISLPLSILNEINALWMESLMCQLDNHDKQTELMLKQDEEFARQLMMKEQELAQAGKEPEVPDMKEIMDMDYAISLYQKDVSKWRKNEPTDLAAKLTREKLYNLFPDVSQDILSELLMAHDNNFQATVEVLLMSTGKSDVLESKNGISKFVMEKELEIKEKILEEERKALAEVKWPLLPNPEEVDMSSVAEYREEADKHLARRNMNYQKAQEYVRRGMTQVANYYSDIANFHKQRYEQANSLAAASLIQVHASNSPDNATIDLHYLRVAEARESLDLFLDTHIQKLKETQLRGGPKYHTLFFITGRGLHSNNGRPRVKPAVKRRLRERGLAFSERNPGLLTTKVSAEDKLSYQVPVA